jgi:hypothetical protein
MGSVEPEVIFGNLEGAVDGMRKSSPAGVLRREAGRRQKPPVDVDAARSDAHQVSRCCGDGFPDRLGETGAGTACEVTAAASPASDLRRQADQDESPWRELCFG